MFAFTGSRFLVVAAALGAGAACSTEVVDDPIIFISNTWEEVGNVNHRFSLESTDDGKTAGAFTGLEFVDAADLVGNPIAGTWNRAEIRMTVTRHAGATLYTGPFADQTNQLALTFSGGTLTIRRRQQ
jgi:hypothetical protein